MYFFIKNGYLFTEVFMKTLFFMVGCMIGCVDDKTTSVESGEVESTDQGIPDDDPWLEPVGLIPAEDCQQINRGDKACNFRLTDQNGETWDLYQHEGDVILLDFSTAWCYPCQMAGMATQGIQDDYKDDGFEFVTVLIDGNTPGQEPSVSEITTWVDSHGITTAPILQGSRDKMLDSTGVGIEGYLLGGYPTYIYIGRDMKFYSAHVGFSEEYVRQTIEDGL
jgi:peroxiredoxin